MSCLVEGDGVAYCEDHFGVSYNPAMFATSCKKRGIMMRSLSTTEACETRVAGASTTGFASEMELIGRCYFFENTDHHYLYSQYSADPADDWILDSCDNLDIRSTCISGSHRWESTYCP